MSIPLALALQALAEYIGTISENLNLSRIIHDLGDQQMVTLALVLIGVVVAMALWSLFMRKY